MEKFLSIAVAYIVLVAIVEVIVNVLRPLPLIGILAVFLSKIIYLILLIVCITMYFQS